VIDALVEAFRGGWVLGLLAVLVALEWGFPWRAPSEGRALRWPTNLTVGALNGLLVTLLLAPVAVAATVAGARWGLLNHIPMPPVLGVVTAIVALDGLLYLQHRVLHASAALWRVHRVHHADVDLDATTALRFHPIEAVIGQATQVAGIVLLGLPPLGVAAYLVLTQLNTVLTHANVSWPEKLERAAQWIVVTPGLHAIHHSALPEESNRNFATVLSVWDRLAATYLATPRDGQANVRAGLGEFREAKYLTLPWTLALPFCSARTADLQRQG
jgi:sterol desaturase/sphingolipid hydroxylase (fatty acid hydroxylase superfamily)